MVLTLRDREILDRVHAVRACDSATLRDFFSTTQALRQRLWRLTRERFLKVHRVGNQRAYSLGRRGVQALGLAMKEVRVSRGSAAHYLLHAQIRQVLVAEGWTVNRRDQVGRIPVMRASRDGHQIATAVCNPAASPRAVRRLVYQLRSLVNPFGPLVDELVIFGPACAHRVTSKLPAVFRSRITIRSLPL
jgi:hypothetical protein